MYSTNKERKRGGEANGCDEDISIWDDKHPALEDLTRDTVIPSARDLQCFELKGKREREREGEMHPINYLTVCANPLRLKASRLLMAWPATEGTILFCRVFVNMGREILMSLYF